jgi:hypothetical protein
MNSGVRRWDVETRKRLWFNGSMKCPKCQHDMHHSNAGWLCFECGHVEQGPKPKAAKTAAPVASEAPQPSPESQTPNVAPEIHHEEPAEKPVKKKRGIPKLAVILSVLTLLLGGAGALAYQAMVLEPKQAPGKYMKKLTEANTAVYKGNLKFSSDDEQYSQFKSTVNFSGKYDITDPKKPRVHIDLDGSLGEGGLNAEVMLLEKMFYFKIEDFDLLSAFGLEMEKDWYKIELSEDQIKDECAEQTDKATAQLAARLPLKDAKLVKLFDKVDGRTVNRYSGSLDLAKLPAIVEEINKDMPADCKMNLDQEDVDTLSIDYDLWSSSNFDRLVLRIKDSDSKSNVELTMDTSDYNKVVDLKAPDNAKEFSLASAAEDPMTTRDNQRKTDLQKYAAGLDAYAANNNGRYPATGRALAASYFQANDPSSGKPYTVAGSLTTGTGKVGVINYGLGFACTESHTMRRVSGTRSYAVVTGLESGGQYCVDNDGSQAQPEPAAEASEPVGTAGLPQLRAFIPFWN